MSKDQPLLSLSDRSSLLTTDSSLNQPQSNASATHKLAWLWHIGGKKLAAEFLGVALFIALIGYTVNSVGNPALAVDLNKTDPTAALVVFAMVNGLGIAVFIVVFAEVSGAFLNPAMVLAHVVVGKFPGSNSLAFGYVIAEVLGSVIGCCMLQLVPHLPSNSTPQPMTLPGANVSPAAALGAEVVASYVLSLVLFTLAADVKHHVFKRLPSYIGMTVAGNVLAFAYISGASMNPARSFGPALLAGNFSLQWVYWLGPSIGCVAGALTHKLLAAPV